MNKPAANSTLGEVARACAAFPHRFQTLHLATCNADGEPEASYAPFVHDRGRYYVYLSELARHTANLRQNPLCSVLFIEPENEAKHPFARQRLTLRCRVHEHARHTPPFAAVMALFKARFGRFMDVIEPLQDFHLFELEPVAGSYVAGFAKAYTLSGTDLAHIHHRREEGHRSPDAAAQARLNAELQA